MNAIETLLLLPFRPRKVAGAHVDTSLVCVYLIHCLGLVAVAGAVLGFEWMVTELDPLDDVTLWQNLQTDPDTVFGCVIVLLCGEACFVLIAAMMTCWAGDDGEPRQSWRHALRISWLYIAHLPWIIVTCGVFVTLGYIHGGMGPRNPVMTGTALTILAGTIIASIVSYLRALTLPREHPPSPRHPTCEWCGYLLAHLDPDGACPECGNPIRLSLELSPRLPIARTWGLIESPWAAWFRAESFFRSIEAHSRSRRAIRLFALSIAVTGIATWATLACTLVMMNLPFGPGQSGGVFLLALPVFGGLGSFFAFMFASATASVAGLFASKHTEQNRFVAAFNVVATIAIILPFWAAANMAAFFLTTSGRVAIPHGETIWLTVNVIIAILFWRAVSRRLKYLRYANR